MKNAFTFVVLIVIPTMAFAQGTVILGNQTGLVKQWTSEMDPTLISVPKGGGYVELFAAPVGTPLLSTLISVAGNNNYSSIAGFLAANPGWALPSNVIGAGTPGLIGLGAGVFADGTYTINNIADGANAEYFLIGWEARFATADAALQAANDWPHMGESAIFTTATSSLVGTPSAPLPVNLRGTFGGMTLFPIDSPEPSSIPLAGLGVAALLVFRRRWCTVESAAMRLDRSVYIAGGLALFLTAPGSLAQGTFQNLDFERATIAPTPAGQWGNFADPAKCFPGWTVGGSGTVVFHNDLSLGAPAVGLMGPSFPNAPGFTPLQGSYSVLLQYFGAMGPPPTLSQTGLVPADAQSITFSTAPSRSDAVVTLNGVPIPLISIGEGRMAGNIAAFAGIEAQLTFSTTGTPGPGGGAGWWLYFDDVQFSPTAIPEPDIFALSALGTLLGWRILGRRRCLRN